MRFGNQTISSSHSGVFISAFGCGVVIGGSISYGPGFYATISQYAGVGGSVWGQVNYIPEYGFTNAVGVYAGAGPLSTPQAGRTFSVETGISPNVKGNLFITGSVPIAGPVTGGIFVEITPAAQQAVAEFWNDATQSIQVTIGSFKHIRNLDFDAYSGGVELQEIDPSSRESVYFAGNQSLKNVQAATSSGGGGIEAQLYQEQYGNDGHAPTQPSTEPDSYDSDPTYVRKDYSGSSFNATTYESTGENQTKTTFVTNPATGQTVPLTTVVGGQVYIPGNVGAGQELSGREQMEHENYILSQLLEDPNFDPNDPTTWPSYWNSSPEIQVPSYSSPYLPDVGGFGAAPAPVNHIAYGASEYGYLNYGSSDSPNVQYSHSAAVQAVMDGRHGTNSITASSGSTVSYDSDHRTSSITSQRSDGSYVTTTTNEFGQTSTSYSDSSDGSGSGGKPILLDLDGDGLETTELSRSTIFMDAGGDGLHWDRDVVCRHFLSLKRRAALNALDAPIGKQAGSL